MSYRKARTTHDKIKLIIEQSWREKKEKNKNKNKECVSTKQQDGRSGVRIPVGAGGLSVFQNVQLDPVTHPASYSMDAGCSFSGEARVK